MLQTAVATRVFSLAIALCLWPPMVGLAPYSNAAPEIPDINSLIDDSGPLPADVAGITAMRDLVFTVPSGLICKSSTLKVMHSLTCSGSGDLPTAPPGTRGVTLPWVNDESSGPAVFFSGPPDPGPGDTAGVASIVLPVGHKVVFWAFSDTRALVCGVPMSADLVCVLKANEATVHGTGPFTNGFIISSSQSRVF